MPPIFKSFVTISVWLLFIKAWLISFVAAYTILMAMGTGKTPPMEGVVACLAGGVEFILACVGAWLRKKLE